MQDVESSRSYIDDLYSPDPEKCLNSIICIKNSVIGSNRQKESVIAQGIVPRLMQLLKDRNMPSSVRLEAAVTIGSLAKGTECHIELLISSGIVQLLLDVLEENDRRLVDASLSCLRTLSQHSSNTFAITYTQRQLQKLLSYAGPRESLLRQSCVSSILSTACRGVAEQNALCAAGAAQILAPLLAVQLAAVRIPVVTCLANMSYENKTVAQEIVNTTYRDIKVLYIIAFLVSRDKPVDMQLEAARCLTNLYRAGAVPAYDQIITFRTLPCLVRLCLVSPIFPISFASHSMGICKLGFLFLQSEYSETQRAMAADTLAYLTEVDSDLQKTAAISNQLVGALVELLNCSSATSRQAAFRYVHFRHLLKELRGILF